MELFVASSLINYFDQILDINCERSTKAYIVKTLSKPTKEYQHSIALAFSQAQSTHRFESYQAIGDWILIRNSIIAPKEEYQELHYVVGSICFYHCYKLLNREWKLYEELADNLSSIINQLQSSLNKKL